MRFRRSLALTLALAGCYVHGQAQTGWEHTPPAPMPVPAEEPQVDADDMDPTALATFRPVLAPHGTWIEETDFGVVWVPSTTLVGAQFSPYVTGGHWAYTAEGYYWVSDYAWGWGPFHYGRWVWADAYGWVWIPGARYSPAWVEWRYGNGYMGWGPAYPHYCFRGGHAVLITVAPTPFVFVQSSYFFHPYGPSQHLLGPEHHGAVFGATASYKPPPRPLHGARPFVGPPPAAAGLPSDHLQKATIAPPVHAKPGAVPWVPTPASKVAPAGKPYTPPLQGKPGATPPGVAPAPTWKPQPAPTYAPKPAPTYAPTPTYAPPTPTYAPQPTYTPTPIPTYAPKPAPTYVPPPAPKPAPTYQPPPAPTFQPAPKPVPTFLPPPVSPAPTATIKKPQPQPK